MGWIKCSTQMPKKGMYVLVSIDFDSETVTPLVKEAEYTGATFRIGPNTIAINGTPRVTHWQEKPQPPQD
ncbi:DUF551 domain-containing protein [Pectobacterium parmentieri]|uniref:DUF551 domain-containing protein n=1 Tax=Pectobacterium parmentieri TaxID=1905730 RepID=UPI000F8C6AA2|nr:DUF551 domain-containing protein [Pectobacterium parmentieri]AZS56762.1 hypothetical protein C5E18_11830 [Pectobacterium parmentieri]MBI0431669.1 DUF551 domain-containing protein [Pectobacterium parmentieri]